MTRLNSLQAAASWVRSKKRSDVRGKPDPFGEGWQEDAWEMYRLVGEFRFAVVTKAKQVARARIYPGIIPADDPEGDIIPLSDLAAPPVNPEDTPERTEEIQAAHREMLARVAPGITDEDINLARVSVEALTSNRATLTDILTRYSINNDVSGEGWLIGYPDHLVRDKDSDGVDDPDWLSPDGHPSALALDSIPVDSLRWAYRSITEVSFSEERGDSYVTLVLEGDEEQKVPEDALILLRIWTPDPLEYLKADSPTKSSLPVLRELVGLTMHVAAQIDSRLAGSGLFLIPSEAAESIARETGWSAADGTPDPLTQQIAEAMMAAIQDRSSASALMPVTARVPQSTIEAFRHISFASPLDDEARELREEAIRRLSLGLDYPPEMMLGTGGMNHWGMWFVHEDNISTHVEPPLGQFANAITTRFQRPILEQQGMDREKAARFCVWYSVEHLIARPNRDSTALSLLGAGELSGAAARRATGFDEADAPEQAADLDPAVAAAMQMVAQAPSLAQSPGLVNLVRELRQLMSGEGLDGPAPPETPLVPDDPPAEEEHPAGGLPQIEDSQGPPEDLP